MQLPHVQSPLSLKSLFFFVRSHEYKKKAKKRGTPHVSFMFRERRDYFSHTPSPPDRNRSHPFWYFFFFENLFCISVDTSMMSSTIFFVGSSLLKSANKKEKSKVQTPHRSSADAGTGKKKCVEFTMGVPKTEYEYHFWDRALFFLQGFP